MYARRHLATTERLRQKHAEYFGFAFFALQNIHITHNGINWMCWAVLSHVHCPARPTPGDSRWNFHSHCLLIARVVAAGVRTLIAITNDWRHTFGCSAVFASLYKLTLKYHQNVHCVCVFLLFYFIFYCVPSAIVGKLAAHTERIPRLWSGSCVVGGCWYSFG